MWSRICVLAVCVAHVWSKLRVDPLVQTKSGLIRGLRADDGHYSMFLGIPYAEINENDPFGVRIYIYVLANFTYTFVGANT